MNIAFRDPWMLLCVLAWCLMNIVKRGQEASEQISCDCATHVVRKYQGCSLMTVVAGILVPFCEVKAGHGRENIPMVRYSRHKSKQVRLVVTLRAPIWTRGT